MIKATLYIYLHVVKQFRIISRFCCVAAIDTFAFYCNVSPCSSFNVAFFLLLYTALFL